MIDPLIIVVIVSVFLLLTALALYPFYRRMITFGAKQKSLTEIDNPDTVIGWTPQSSRIFSNSERNAHELLVSALPGYTILGQVPLSRFIKVTSRYSYSQWLKRVGNHCVDLIVADHLSRVVAVIEVRSEHSPADHSSQKKDRVVRVLEAARISVFEWIDGEFPSISQIRALFRVPDFESEALGAAEFGNDLSFHEQNPDDVNFYIASEALSDDSASHEGEISFEPNTDIELANPELLSDESIEHQKALASIDLNLPNFDFLNDSGIKESVTLETNMEASSHTVPNIFTQESSALPSSTDMLTKAWLENERQIALFEDMTHKKTGHPVASDHLFSASIDTGLEGPDSLKASKAAPQSKENKEPMIETALTQEKMKAEKPNHHHHSMEKISV